MTCKCTNVTLYDNGWQCILCARKFFPADQVTEADEQLLVVEPDTKCYRNHYGAACYCKNCRL